MKSIILQAQATLATIRSYSENKVLADLVGTYEAWIGGFRQYGNTFNWPRSSNTYMNYKNFCPGEPNNQGGNENCLDIYGSQYRKDWAQNREKWNDISCTRKFGYVCETSRDVI